jgi:hypothetical protein
MRLAQIVMILTISVTVFLIWLEWQLKITH